MKLVKKILRLLPIFYLLTPLLILIFNKGIFNGIDPSTNLNTYLPNLYGFIKYTIFVEDFTVFINLPFINPLYSWFTSYFGNSVYFQFAFVVIFYELFLSIIFLMFDFINMIFSWTNKLINKGGNLDD